MSSLATSTDSTAYAPIDYRAEPFADAARAIGHAREDSHHVVETLIRQHYAYVQRLALSILDDNDEAEDATQETFISAALAIDRYRGQASLKTWLTAIAINTCRGHLRKRKTRQTLQSALQAVQSLMGRPPTAEESVLRAEADEQVWAALDALGEKHRLPVILRYVHGLSTMEIADVLGIHEGTVHSRLHYARRKLHERLSQSGVFRRQAAEGVE